MAIVDNANTLKPITQKQIDLVRATFAQIEPSSELAASLFYGRLFEIAPEVRPLFKSDLEAQGKKLMQMIAVAVANLDNLSAIFGPVRALGVRHLGYGVQPAHYAVVGEALIWTLEQGLGESFTPEVNAAWTNVYATLAETMQQAGNG